MRKLFYLLLIISFSQCTSNGYMKLQPQYEQEKLGLVPDYSQMQYWAAHPDKKDPSDSLPKPLKKDAQISDKADIFFVHPTSYLDTNKPTGWNASLSDAKLNLYTDYTSILNQASIFNQAGKIYAPRYRQAHINSYSPKNSTDTLNAVAAFELAYQDVKTAFEYYLAHYNNGRPIIIASHSQGSTHTKRLLKEFFDNKPLAKKLIAAYVVGMAIDPGDYTQLKACETPTSTGCICAWRTYQEGYIPDFVVREKFNSIVTNPLSWSKSDPIVDRKMNEGSVLYNFDKIIPHVADAINHEGILWTKKPHFLGSFLYRTSNYHIADYNFYYLSVRQNAVDRVNSYFKSNSTN
jgi:hypothetical protein